MKVIASDIDGTLLGPDRRLTARTVGGSEPVTKVMVAAYIESLL